MRVLNALRADMRFQFKQGFYLVYIVITAMYMLIIGRLPQKIADIAVPLVVFSDPSVVGFFFIGGIIMLEKVQGVLQYIAVTPLRPVEYLLAKVISLSVLAEAAGLAITAVTYRGSVNWLLLAAGILLTSVSFTLCGFAAAADCDTVNRYFIKMIPYMLFMVLPCFSAAGFPYSWLLDIFPGAAGLKLVLGAFNGIGAAGAVLYTIYLTLFDILVFFKIAGALSRMGGGGVD